MRALLIPGTGIKPESGGQGSFCRYLAEGLLESGHSVEIAGDYEWTGFCKGRDIALHTHQNFFVKDIDIIHVSGPGIRNGALGLISRHKVLFTHQDYRYLCPANTAWTPSGCVANGCAGPCHYCPARDLRSRAHVRMLRLAASFCCNVAVSSYVLRRLSLPNGHAILSPIRSEPSSAPQNSHLIAFAGRLVPEKGVSVLIHAASQMSDVELELAGDGPMLPSLRQLVADLGITARVRFLGALSLEGVRDLYRRATVVCVPSIWDEPFGYAAAEALAIGRALVTSDRGAFPELVGGSRGWLCSAEDPHEWANTLRNVFENDDERARRCQAAARFVVDELDPGCVAKRYVKAYENHLANTHADRH
jgi:glycosyltransferase involved in cell wall biosynthesis